MTGASSGYAKWIERGLTWSGAAIGAATFFASEKAYGQGWIDIGATLAFLLLASGKVMAIWGRWPMREPAPAQALIVEKPSWSFSLPLRWGEQEVGLLTLVMAFAYLASLRFDAPPMVRTAILLPLAVLLLISRVVRGKQQASKASAGSPKA